MADVPNNFTVFQNSLVAERSLIDYTLLTTNEADARSASSNNCSCLN